MEFRPSGPLLLVMVVLGTYLTDAALEKRPEIYSLHIVSDIKFRFATTLVTSRVKNTDNEQAREALFDVTLPNEAFISNFTLEIDGKIIQGEVKEKEEAKEQYTAAVQRGESAGIISAKQRETNKFNLRISVAPQSKVTFNLTYEELLKRQLGRYEQVIYINPGQPVEDMSVTVSIIESCDITELIIPPLRNDVMEEEKIGENPLAFVVRPSNKSALITFIPSMEDHIALSDQGISAQFRVRYDVDRQQNAGEIMVVNGYFVHFFAPSGYDPLPKDVLFVLDTSGSMQGVKMNQLRDAMHSMLNQLHSIDRVNIMKFSGGTYFWQDGLQNVTEENIDAAIIFVDHMKAGGGTNINDALVEGVQFLSRRSKDQDEHISPVLVFLTDGEATSGVTNPDQILGNVKRTNEREIPIFTLAFGRHADYGLLKKIAIENNGLGRKIYDASDAALQITGFYDEISNTLLKNVTFKYLDAPVTNVTKSQFHSYFDGSEVVVCGRVPRENTGEDEDGNNTNTGEPRVLPLGTVDTRMLTLQVSSYSAQGPIVLEMGGVINQMNFGGVPNMTHTGDFERITEKIWAYLTIKQLLEKELVTTDTEMKKELTQKALSLSLLYNFVTPLTSMVVTKPTGEVQDTVLVADEEESATVARQYSQAARRLTARRHPQVRPKMVAISYSGIDMSDSGPAMFATQTPYFDPYYLRPKMVASPSSGVDMIDSGPAMLATHTPYFDPYYPTTASVSRAGRKKTSNHRGRKRKNKDKGATTASVSSAGSRKARKNRGRKRKNKDTEVYSPLTVRMDNVFRDLFCFPLLAASAGSSNTRAGWNLLYNTTGLILSAEVAQPLLSDKEQIATIQAVNISTAQSQVMIRHHLVEGGCFTNNPWTQQWSTSCPDGLQISSANGTLTITKGEIQFAIQHIVSKAGHSQLQLTVDLNNFTQGHGGLLEDIAAKRFRRFAFKGRKELMFKSNRQRVIAHKRTLAGTSDFCWMPERFNLLHQPLKDYSI